MVMAIGPVAAEFVRHLIGSELNSIPYFTRVIKMDRVGFEPTTHATIIIFIIIAAHYGAAPPSSLVSLTFEPV